MSQFIYDIFLNVQQQSGIPGDSPAWILVERFLNRKEDEFYEDASSAYHDDNGDFFSYTAWTPGLR